MRKPPTEAIKAEFPSMQNTYQRLVCGAGGQRKQNFGSDQDGHPEATEQLEAEH